MSLHLLLVNADGIATTAELAIRELREFPGGEGVSVHFRPVRNDRLFESAKAAGSLGYRILRGEGVVRAQLWVEFEVRGAHINVTGRSSDLLFALAMITAKWPKAARALPAIAATGVLDAEGSTLGDDGAAAGVQAVDHAVAKVAAAVQALAHEREAIVFFPAADAPGVARWRETAEIPGNLRLQPVGRLEDALGVLGITLEKVYLGNPFRGLQQFDYAHRSIFFGRDAEVGEILEQLLRRESAGTPGVLVEGASGSGKSSFLRAGVLPALINPASQPRALAESLRQRPVPESAGGAIWQVGLLPAGVDEAGIAASIGALWSSLPQLRNAPKPDAATLTELAGWRRAHWPAGQRCVWLLDQFEELFTLGLAPATLDAFASLLLLLQNDGVWTLASIRADAVPELKLHPLLRQVFGANEGQYYLETISATALDDVINRPARAAGLVFGLSPSGESLERLLKEDAYRDRDNALPLLQFTLFELYQRRSGRELSCAVYEQLGGLSGSVAAKAASILQSGGPDTQSALQGLFRSLIMVDDSGRAARRYARLSEITGDPEQKRILLSLVDARLCVTDQRDGHAVVAFAHEALLRTWPALIEWLQREAGLLQVRELAQRETTLWLEHGSSPAWLVPADKLAIFTPLREAGIALPAPVIDFIERSRQRARRGTLIKRAVVGAIALLAIVASAAGWQATRKQREAEYQAAQARAAQARAAMEARTARATVEFLSTIFDAPTPESSLGHAITARELLDAGAQRLNSSLVAAPDVRARLTERVGKAYRQIGDYDRAAPLLASAVAQYAALTDAPPQDRVEALTEIAILYGATDQRKKALAALEDAMHIDAGLPPDQRNAAPQIACADIETDAADFGAAKSALEQARVILESRHQPENRENYFFLLRYSHFYYEQGRFQEAERYGLEAVAAQERILGTADSTAVGAALNMQVIYMQTLALGKAEVYGRRARDLSKQIYGENHPSYAAALMEYADTLGSMGKAQEAERLLRQALQIRLKTLGPEHTLTGYAYYNLGNAVADQGRSAEALTLIERSQHIWEVSEGLDHPDVGWALDMQSRLLIDLGRSAEAIPLSTRAMVIAEKAYGPNHPNVGRAWMWVGVADVQLHRFPQAVDALARALHITEASFGATSDRVARVLEYYAKALRGSGKTGEARAALERAAKIRAGNRAAHAVGQ